MDKGLEDNFPKESIQMKTEQMKICPAPLTIRRRRVESHRFDLVLFK